MYNVVVDKRKDKRVDKRTYVMMAVMTLFLCSALTTPCSALRIGGLLTEPTDTYVVADPSFNC